MTEQLIRFKHSENMCAKFEEALNKPHKMKLCWNTVAEVFEVNISGDAAKIKYNHLLSKYRDELVESKKSGASTPKWKYWSVFHSTFPASLHHTMPNVVELGDESFIAQTSSTANSLEDYTVRCKFLKPPLKLQIEGAHSMPQQAAINICTAHTFARILAV
ncbi:hypothetical protein ENBRE01_3416, partial [Enteropsectra breve]